MKSIENNKARICLSFDDGRQDNRAAAELLLKKGIPASFNITSGYVDRTCPDELKPTKKEALSVEDVKWLNEQSIFEIALHGNNHLNTVEDISAGRDKIIEWLELKSGDKLGFASPGTGIKLDLLNDDEKAFFDKEVSYIRVSLRIKSNKYVRVLARKASRLIHSPLLYLIAYKDTCLNKDEDKKIIHSIPIMGDITFNQVKKIIKYCAKNEKDVVLMLHSIEKPDEKADTWSWEWNKFESLVDFLCEMRKEQKLDVCTVEKLYISGK